MKNVPSCYLDYLGYWVSFFPILWCSWGEVSIILKVILAKNLTTCTNMELGKNQNLPIFLATYLLELILKNLTIGRTFFFKIWRIWAIFFNRLKSFLLVEIIVFQVGIWWKLASKRNAANDSLLGMFPQQGALPIIKQSSSCLLVNLNICISLSLGGGSFLQVLGGGDRLSLFIDNHLIRFSQKLWTTCLVFFSPPLIIIFQRPGAGYQKKKF
jgi:hypothetical protein